MSWSRTPGLKRNGAAFHCFAQAGFHATSVDDIVKQTGVSKGTFYWYFETKEQVFVQILDVWAHEVEAEIMAQFRAAFEDEHGVGVLTDGKKVLGLGYSADVTPFGTD